MSDNPYRFTVEVDHSNGKAKWWVHVAADNTVLGADDEGHPTHIWLPFSTEAEANEHAELIRQAMREVS